MRFRDVALLAAALSLAFQAGTARADEGLSTDFGNVVLNNIPQGSAYVLSSRPVRVTNKGERTIGIDYEAALPAESDLVPGYEAIPDISWIGFSRTSFGGVKGGGTTEAILRLTVPADSKYAGKRYQAFLWLHSSAGSLGMLGLGVKPRLNFKVADAGVDVRAGADRDLKANLGPPEIRTAGETVVALACEPLKAENSSATEMEFEFGVPDPGDSGLTTLPLKEGREALPGDARIVCGVASLRLAPRSSSDVGVQVQLLPGHKYAGRRFQGTLRSRIRSGASVLNVLTAVFVDVPGASGSKSKKKEK